MNQHRKWGLLAMAARLVPNGGKDRYLAEWAAEDQLIKQSTGALSAWIFRLHVLLGAPRLSFALRTARHPAMFDSVVVGLTLLVPALLFTVHALVTGVYALAALYFVLTIGLSAFSQSSWSSRTGLVGDRKAKLGLLITVLATIGITVMHRVMALETPMATAAFVTYPGVLITSLGTVLLLVSTHMPRLRVPLAHFGASALIAGFVVWCAAAVANAWLAPNWLERVYHLGIVPSAFAVSLVCVRVVRSGSRFVVPRGRVIPHQ